jgi:hypothetical protein
MKTSIITLYASAGAELFLLGLTMMMIFPMSSSAPTSSQNTTTTIDFDVSTILESATDLFNQTQCGISLASLVNFVMTDDACPSLFHSITDFMSNIEVPSVSLSAFGTPQVSFNITKCA